MTKEQLLPVIYRVMDKLMNLGASDLVYDKSMTEEQIETGLFARDFGIEEWLQGVGLYGLYKLQKFYGMIAIWRFLIIGFVRIWKKGCLPAT